MTSSNTWAFQPTNSETVLEAFDRCGIRPTAITREQMVSARRSLNLALQAWGNKGVNLWEVDLVELELEQGVTDYDADPNTISILDAYIRTVPNAGEPIDRILYQISRTDWAMIPNKDQQGYPNVLWYEKLLQPKIHIWQPPDNSQIYLLRYYRMIRVQDAAVASGQTPDVPVLFADALCADLAARLARKYAPPIYDSLKMDAKEAWDLAATENRENAPIMITPMLSGYWTN